MKETNKPAYTPQELEEKVQAYFDACRETLVESKHAKAEVRKPPTMEGLGAYLALSQQTLKAYMQTQYPAKAAAARRRIAECLVRAREYMAAQTLEGALLGWYDAKICSMVLEELGYGEKGKQTVLPETTVRIEWANVAPEEMQNWAE